MTYLPGESKVIYCSKDGKQEKVFDALEWLAAMPACACPHADMGSHVPSKAEQMVRYYGYYSNVSWGKRGKLNLDEDIPCILISDEGAKKYRKNWARLIQKIGACPRLDRGRRIP